MGRELVSILNLRIIAGKTRGLVREDRGLMEFIARRVERDQGQDEAGFRPPPRKGLVPELGTHSSSPPRPAVFRLPMSSEAYPNCWPATGVPPYEQRLPEGTRPRLSCAQFTIWQSRLFIRNLSRLVRREMGLPDPCFCSTERRQRIPGALSESTGFKPECVSNRTASRPGSQRAEPRPGARKTRTFGSRGGQCEPGRLAVR
jgi:hypothetical protein